MNYLKTLQAVGAWSAKSYNQPCRAARQRILDAARTLSMKRGSESESGGEKRRRREREACRGDIGKDVGREGGREGREDERMIKYVTKTNTCFRDERCA